MFDMEKKLRAVVDRYTLGLVIALISALLVTGVPGHSNSQRHNSAAINVEDSRIVAWRQDSDGRADTGSHGGHPDVQQSSSRGGFYMHVMRLAGHAMPSAQRPDEWIARCNDSQTPASCLPQRSGFCRINLSWISCKSVVLY